MTGSDPFEDNAPPSSFATTYQRQAGEMMVYGGTFFGLFFLLGGVMSSVPGLYLLAIVMLAAAFYFFPMVRTEKAQLKVEPKGLYLDGMGWLPWTGIRNVRIYDRSVRTIRNAHLELTLAAPIEEIVISEDKEDPLRDLMTKVWSPKRGEDGRAATVVVVKLEPLRASPEEILAAIRRHLHHV
ncbi:hypothetical protein [Pyruvatibacter mobilis]|uniref:hypothetical protein n=1 Tax=Pyruvatibacter mobilis TaxID=1712261 RepID=UPI003C7A08B6